MARLDEIFKKYSEKVKLNSVDCTILSRPKFPLKKFPLVLDLNKFDGKEMLFSVDDAAIRLRAEKELRLEEQVDPNGEIKYNYLFWIEEQGFKDKEDKVTLQYLKCGRIERHGAIDIAFGDDIIYYVTQSTKKEVKSDDIPGRLYNNYAFSTPNASYLFIETFPNSDRNFRVHGLRAQVDIRIEDGKWIMARATKKPFPGRYDDFLTYCVVKFKNINFVKESEAQETFEHIRLRDEIKGDTILSLWKTYSSIEEKRAHDFQEKVGELRFSAADLRKDGVTKIKLEPNESQEKLLSEEIDAFLTSSFNVSGADEVVSFKSYDKHLHLATIINEEYPIKQNASGVLTVNVKGDEAVQRRRESALKQLNNHTSLVLINLRLAIEGQSSKMLPRSRKLKPLSENTRKFIKERFGINDLTDDQKKAVDIAINTPDIAVIQGPPGTGKSTVVAVICQRLIELAEKGELLDKVILASAFQNDTVEHIASKIETFGLPTIKVGKNIQGVRAEDGFIAKMQRSIDTALQSLSPENKVDRMSMKLRELKLVLSKENDAGAVRSRINDLIRVSDFSEELLSGWKLISREVKLEDGDRGKAINALKGLRTDAGTYSDDGFMRIRKVLKAGISFTEEERELLEYAPSEDEAISDDFLESLKEIQEKYLTAIYAVENTVKGGIDASLEAWIDEAIDYFKKKEESSYEDVDTFLTANLENIREDLFGSSGYIRETIRHYGQSVAATNQFSGSMEVNNLRYENVILEEAARSNPLDLIIPMVRASERIIMVGDQKQLPHLLENDIVDEAIKGDAEKRKKYEESLFGILYDNLAQASPKRRVRLTKQFRMHPVIGDFISETYYDNQISSEMVNPAKKLHGLSIPWAKDKVAVFCNVPNKAGLESRGGRSKERIPEAIRIVKLLNELREDPAFENLSVGIISFYSKQVDRILEEVSKYGYTERDGEGSYHIASAYQLTKDGREKLRIGSVDSFQGKEFDIVILSTVRSNNILRIEENNLRVFGFLTLENRLNVAFSRAQKMLITVGDADMFNDEYADIYVHGLYDFYTKLTAGDYGSRI